MYKVTRERQQYDVWTETKTFWIPRKVDAYATSVERSAGVGSWEDPIVVWVGFGERCRVTYQRLGRFNKIRMIHPLNPVR